MCARRFSRKYAANSIFTLEEKNRHTELSGSLDIFERRKGRWSTNALVASKYSLDPPPDPLLAPTQVLIRGNYLQPGEAVEPGFPTAMCRRRQACNVLKRIGIGSFPPAAGASRSPSGLQVRRIR